VAEAPLPFALTKPDRGDFFLEVVVKDASSPTPASVVIFWSYRASRPRQHAPMFALPECMPAETCLKASQGDEPGFLLC
jgi:hypothetical protein